MKSKKTFMEKQIKIEQIPKSNKINLNPKNKKDYHGIRRVKTVFKCENTA